MKDSPRSGPDKEPEDVFMGNRESPAEDSFAGDTDAPILAEGLTSRRGTARGEELSLDAVDAQGISLQDILAGPKAEEPNERAGHVEWLLRVAKVFERYVEEGKADLEKKGHLPVIERAWVLWNEHFVDYYLELAELREDDTILSSLPLPPAPVDVFPPEGKGQHNPEWSDYLARYIGVLRGWSESQMEGDLAQQRTPKDLSKLRAAVRIRRNESKRDIGDELRKMSG